MQNTLIAILAGNGSCIGTAFVLSPALAITAAHVIRDAAGESSVGPGCSVFGIIIVRDGHHLRRQFTVCEGGWFPPDSTTLNDPDQLADLALLRFDAPPSLLKYPNLSDEMPTSGTLAVTGFVSRNSRGGSDFVTETIHGRVESIPEVNGWIRATAINITVDMGLPGLSGAPACSPRNGKVYGLFSQGQQTRGRWLVIPTRHIKAASSKLQPAVSARNVAAKKSAKRIVLPPARAISSGRDLKHEAARIIRSWDRTRS